MSSLAVGEPESSKVGHPGEASTWSGNSEVTLVSQDSAPDLFHKRVWPKALALGGAIMLLAGVALVLFSSSLSQQAMEGNSTYHPAERQQNATTNTGIVLNGQSSYGEAANFDQPIDQPVMIEAIVTPEVGPNPAHVASWTGENCMYLFTSDDGHWGVAFLYEGEPRLEVLLDPIRPGTTYLLGARWDGQNLEILLDGQPMQTDPSHYPLFSTDPKLCVGGAAPGLLPEDQGTRFLAGTLHQLRLSKGVLPMPARNADELTEKHPSTVALFLFDQGQGDRVTDLSGNNVELQLHNTQWAPR